MRLLAKSCFVANVIDMRRLSLRLDIVRRDCKITVSLSFPEINGDFTSGPVVLRANA